MATGIGDTLRDARQRRGISLEDAAAETRIRATHLVALEQEEFDRLGGDVYVRGFLRSYAKVLHVDPEPLLASYGEAADRRAEREPPLPVSVEPLERRPRRGVGVAVAAVALIAIIGLAVMGGERDDRVEVDDPLADDRVDTEPDDVGATDPAPTPTARPTDDRADEDEDEDGDGIGGDDGDGVGGDDGDDVAEPVEGVAVGLDVSRRDAWVRVLVDGSEVFQGLLSPGDSRTYEGDEVRLRIGEPAAVELTVNGEHVGTVGEPGQPVWVTVDEDGDVSVS